MPRKATVAPAHHGVVFVSDHAMLGLLCSVKDVVEQSRLPVVHYL